MLCLHCRQPAGEVQVGVAGCSSPDDGTAGDGVHRCPQCWYCWRDGRWALGTQGCEWHREDRRDTTRRLAVLQSTRSLGPICSHFHADAVCRWLPGRWRLTLQVIELSSGSQSEIITRLLRANEKCVTPLLRHRMSLLDAFFGCGHSCKKNISENMGQWFLALW